MAALRLGLVFTSASINYGYSSKYQIIPIFPLKMDDGVSIWQTENHNETTPILTQRKGL